MRPRYAVVHRLAVVESHAVLFPDEQLEGKLPVLSVHFHFHDLHRKLGFHRVLKRAFHCGEVFIRNKNFVRHTPSKTKSEPLPTLSRITYSIYKISYLYAERKRWRKNVLMPCAPSSPTVVLVLIVGWSNTISQPGGAAAFQHNQ